MGEKEALARVKINKLLEEAHWRFFDTSDGTANISLEDKVTITGEEYQNNESGFTDYLLLDERRFPIAVLEAKRDQKDPILAKEQARQYANALKLRFIILSNGELTYFWDLENGNPTLVSYIPTQKDIQDRLNFKPEILSLQDEKVNDDYIVLSQNPNYRNDSRWIDTTTRTKYSEDNKFKFLRNYQLNAIKALQHAAKEGKNRFLFEMATGTGKTLISAAIIKLYLKTGNARRILFLVDRLELEDQAYKNFVKYLSKDYRTVIYKDAKDEWKTAEIVVTTIQSISYDEKYKKIFTPNDFDLIISDEAHRSVSGTNRNVFEYFLGHKLGLTATPKDYLKNFDVDEFAALTPREQEIRNLKSTYKIFGCESGEPTYRFGLVEGVKEGFLIAPTVIDCRTDITTKLLSDEGYTVEVHNEDEEGEITFTQKDFERKFFSDETNAKFVEVFMNNALQDPISKEIGKTIVFAVSQKHATKLTTLLNEYAEKYYPGKYNSDFAVQVTSFIPDAQGMTVKFSENNLNGKTRFLDGYDSSKTRVCITVGMMTTGYDCPDLLNICLVRPIFSPSDFVQIKGRGTRKTNFEYIQRIDGENQILSIAKTNFKIFDYFGNFEYFEEKYDYDQKLELPKEVQTIEKPEPGPVNVQSKFDSSIVDLLNSYREKTIDIENSRIDNELFGKTSKKKREDEIIIEFSKFNLLVNLPNYLEQDALNLFIQYCIDSDTRNIIEQKEYQKLSSNINFYESIKHLGRDYIELVIKYIKEHKLC